MALAMPAAAVEDTQLTEAVDAETSDALPATTDDEATDTADLVRRRRAANLLAGEFLRKASPGDNHISHAFAYKVVSAWGCSHSTWRKRLRQSDVTHQQHDTLGVAYSLYGEANASSLHVGRLSKTS